MSEAFPEHKVVAIVEPPIDDCRFGQITKKLTRLYIAKNKDYGDSFGRSIRKYGLVAALTRISDKFNRAENLIINRGEPNIKDESINDTLLDLAAYCIMTTIEIENANQNQETAPGCGGAE